MYSYFGDTTLERAGWSCIEPALEIFALLLKFGDHRRVRIECQKLVEDRNPFGQFIGRHRQRLGGIIILVANIQMDPPDPARANQRRFIREDSVADMGLDSAKGLRDGGPSRERDAAFLGLLHQSLGSPGLITVGVG